MRTPLTLAALLLLAPTLTSADITARFIESAPKDRFEFTNTSGCDTDALVLSLDLSSSAAGLIFDTTATGAGVQVFQPFDLVAGGDLLSAVPDVTDGTSRVDLPLSRFPAGATLAFTVDVDDTLAQGDLGQTRVSGSEISGATLRDGTSLATFDTQGRALLKRAPCIG